MAFGARHLSVVLTLLFSGAQLWGASSAEKSFNAAAKNFRDGFWEQAARGFAEFVRDHPDSPKIAEAILYQAQANITNGQYAAGIAILSTNEFRAGPWADQYLFWVAHAHLRNNDFAAAANAFQKLLVNFPASSVRFDSAIGAATALSLLEQWPRVVGLLQDTNGVFQQAAAVGVANEGIPYGYLLLGEAHLALTNYNAVDGVLRLLEPQKLKPDLAWRRYYLQCRRQLAAGFPEAALLTTTNLIALAADANSRRLQAETTALEAGIYERLNSLEKAIATWQRILATNAPVEHQCRALEKITELNLALDKPAEAVRTLQEYLDRSPASGVVDLATLTIGELQLRLYLAETNTNQPDAATNLLIDACDRFDRVLTTNTNSPWRGRALLDKGWCLWAGEQYARSEEPFRQAAEWLPASEDQAVARFKWADSQLAQGKFAAAVTNYQFVVANYQSWPEVRDRLMERALYQMLRAALEAKQIELADEAREKILASYPDGFAGDRALLYVGEGYLQQKNPARARRLFVELEELYPTSPRLPESRLAVARTYEQEGDWTAAITNYVAWISTFTNSARLPEAEFRLASATSMAGLETNALALYTNFVVRYPDSELAPHAQWCVGLYYYGHADFYNARKNFLYLFGTWTNSDLACDARMMAGRSAIATVSYKDAIGYFTELYTNAACGVDLKIEAAIRAGNALMSWNEVPEAPNRQAHLEKALEWFQSVARSFPNHPLAPSIWIRIGDCNFQWAASDPQKYVAASNAYQRALTFTNASETTRDQARIALAIVAEKTGDDAAALRFCQAVLNHAYDSDAEKPDQFLVKEAVLRAGRLAAKMQLWSQAANVYTNAAVLLPALRPAFEAKALEARKHMEAPD